MLLIGKIVEVGKNKIPNLKLCCSKWPGPPRNVYQPKP